MFMDVFARGVTERVCPVHARSALRCVAIQSTVPLRCTTTIDVIGDFVEMRAVIGLVDVMRW
jgi:hypothetical protein